MTKLANPIVVPINDELNLQVRTAWPTRTAFVAQVEVLNGKTIHTDEVKLGSSRERRKFAKEVGAKAPGADMTTLEEKLLLVANEVESALQKAETAKMSEVRYTQSDQGIYELNISERGTATNTLTNFGAKILRQTIEDDGASEQRQFLIELSQEGKTRATKVPADQYTKMDWPINQGGAKFVVRPGWGNKDKTRAAIQELSGDAEEKKVFTHTGWRKIKDEWFYLHSGGAIGTAGNTASVKVWLPGSLASYELPEPPVGDRLRESIRASFNTLLVAPKHITLPLLGGVYRTPLGEARAVDHSVFIDGRTGTQKTEETAIAQSHFGAGFNSRNLPESWESTANALERNGFLTKDTILTVDDFKPRGGTNETQDPHSKADKLLRGQGNQQGRSRMNADGSGQQTYYPRGLVLASGEDVPTGHSLQARMVVLEVVSGDVNLTRLTEAQSAARDGLFASAMSGYVQWLAGRMDQLKAEIPDRIAKLRDMFRAETTFSHDRVPDNLASLLTGYESFIDLALEAHEISPEERSNLWDEAWAVLLKVGENQGRSQAQQDEVDRFCELLSTALQSGRAHLNDAKTIGPPSRHGQWGWRVVEHAPTPCGACVGWLDGSDLLLDPGVAFSVVQQLAQQEQGASIPIAEQTLWKRMSQRKLLLSTEENRHTARKMIGGDRKRVIHLNLSVLSGESGPSGPSSPEETEK